MDLILFGLGLVTLCHLLFTLIELKIGFKKIKNLSEQAALQDENLPFISIILSALNEEDTLENAIASLLSLNYPHFEIIAINDRSTDKTPQILENFKTLSNKIRVFHIQNLPEGWLGKNHALHFASTHAKGEWLLFTDADVIMKDNGLARAVSYAIAQNVDHLTIYEHHIRKNFWLKILLLGSYATYSMFVKPWRIRYRWSKQFLGHGAFNLVKTTVYKHIGGHRAIAMECLDDLMLGKLFKSRGYKQDIMNGNHFIEREWYHSAWEMVEGLKKNSFAFFNFQLTAVIRDFIFAILYFIWPLLAVFILSGINQWINLTIILLTFYIITCIAKQFRLHRGFALLYPLSISMLLYTVWNSVFSIYKNNGVVWRETHYSLAKLKNNKFISFNED